MPPEQEDTKNEANVSTTKKGTNYELMVQKIYESMLEQDAVDAVVETKKKLKVTDSSRPVEVDLYWEFKRAGVTISEA